MTSEVPLPLLGRSPAMRALNARVDELQRDSSRAVMILGAHGMGKRYLAQRLHQASALSAAPFLRFDPRRESVAVLQALVSGATPRTTLLVSHIDALSHEGQRVLDAGTGARSAVARLMATTAEDIAALVTAGTFLESLYYRLFAWPMVLPSLAEREEADVLLLAHAVLEQTADGDDSLPVMLNAEAATDVARYAWPGNLREMEATLALAQLHARGAGTVALGHLPIRRGAVAVPASAASLADVERWHLLRAVELFRGNRTHAARSLGLSRMTLISKLKQYGEQGDT